LILTRSQVNMHSELVVTISTHHGLDVSDLLTNRFLFAFEQIAQLDWRHHLATSVHEFNQHDALVFEVLVELVVLFFKGCDFVVFHDLLVLLQVVVVNVPVHEEVLNLKCVHFLLVFQQFYWQDVFFLCDQTCRVALFENAHFG
jgi:hypothetical protein